MTRPELADALDRLWPGYQSVLAGLIRIPSLLGDEAQAQHYLATAAGEAGLEVELWDVDPAEVERIWMWLKHLGSSEW